jgi:hypothetical protein
MSRTSWVWVMGALLIVGCNHEEKLAPKPVAAALPPIPAWPEGSRFLYATHLNSKLVLGGQPLMGFDLDAKLALEARQAGGETEFLAEISEAKFKGVTADTQGQFDALARELDEPFGFSTSQGALSSLRLPPTWSRFAVSISRTLAAGVQLAAPGAGEKGRRWKAREVDATGHYEVEYTPSKDNPLLIAKHKLRYDSLSLGKGITLGQFAATVAPEVAESTGKVELGSEAGGPQLKSLDYRERINIQLTPTSLIHSETSLSLVYERLQRLSTQRDWTAVLAHTTKMAADRVPVDQTPSSNYDAQRIGDYTFDKALAELEAQARDPHRNELVESVRGQPFKPDDLQERRAKLDAQGHAFIALSALLRSDVKNIPRAVASVRGHSPATRGLLDSLASAGTKDTQAALVSLMNDAKLELPLRRAAASSLIRTERATAESVSALQAHVATSDPLHVFAVYGLGTISRRLREAGEVAQADAIVQGLVAQLKAVHSPTDQVDALRAIANSGGVAAFDAVIPLLEAKDLNVRVAAVDAVRLMQRPEVDGIIAKSLGQPEASVQEAALDAVSVRTPTPALVAALQRAATSAAKPGLRLKAVRIMVRWLPLRPELRPSLEHLAASDELEQVRKEAQAALGP